MRYNALLVAGLLFALGALLAAHGVRDPLGIALTDAWQLALGHAWIGLAPVLFLPRRGGRTDCLGNLLAAAACWAAGLAAILCFSFAATTDRTWQFASIGGAAWLACGGALSLAARGRGRWVGTARVALLCAFSLPVLWHYLALEYGGASMLDLRPLSPNWMLAADEFNLWPMVIWGAVSSAAALALPERGEA
jgi:hypothetical protein